MVSSSMRATGGLVDASHVDRKPVDVRQVDGEQVDASHVDRDARRSVTG
jgi:hypothetical protein